MTTIGKYLEHTVTIIKETELRGEITVTEIPDVEAYISTIQLVERGLTEDILVTRTLLFLLPDANIDDKDKVRVDGIVRPIYKINKPKFVGKIANHLEVILD